MSLIVENLVKRYGTKTVVDGLSFEMKEHGVYALLGTNGAGKTTAIRMILGMLSKDGGRVEWMGKPLDISTCNVGYLAEERGLYPKYSLMDQLMYFASLRGVSAADARKRIKYLSERLEADEYLYPNKQNASAAMLGEKTIAPRRVKAEKPKLADQLSKGNQQKIQFMIALISDPELIVLDEPLSGLDPVNTDLFKKIIQEEIERGKYVIMSSHQMATVEEFCTDITIMNRSKPILQGHLNDIKKSYGRVNLYIKTEEDISRFIAASGASLLSRKENEYRLKVTGEEMANALLSELISAGVMIITFNLSEPSLHDIFVEKVGEYNEADKE
ncbi:MAG: ABC transporter ATP-binding protein [Eubacteriales bacterium]